MNKCKTLNNSRPTAPKPACSVCRPLLLVLSAPSGGGKTTLCHRLLEAVKSMRYSISCTTRPPRGDEVNGRAYHFLTLAAFRQRAQHGDFLEYATVHGHDYGTPRVDVEAELAAGHDVLLDIDVQGARTIRKTVSALPIDHILHRAYVDVFIAPPSIEVLEQRLRARAQDDPSVIARRLCNALTELQGAPEYRYLIVNDVLDEAFVTLQAIVTAEHHRNIDRKEYE